ncbi:unnamed protein product [Prorocentrum cordatum]|uniref:Transmembrane protein 107 n=1 Tax=Prorocentrum cordatum TaxID=2364126 RepID=A0ABN9T821_9DINO|nr:unnamed protein product [Polarella glacialis]
MASVYINDDKCDWPIHVSRSLHTVSSRLTLRACHPYTTAFPEFHPPNARTCGLHALLAPQLLGNVIFAIVAILMGVVCTQMIHAVCVTGYFTSFPLHSFWHLCSSTSASFTVWILDEGLLMVDAKRHASSADEGSRAALTRPIAPPSDKRH